MNSSGIEHISSNFLITLLLYLLRFTAATMVVFQQEMPFKSIKIKSFVVLAVFRRNVLQDEFAGPISASLRLRATQLLSTKCRSGGESLATLVSDLTCPKFWSTDLPFRDERVIARPPCHSRDIVTKLYYALKWFIFQREATRTRRTKCVIHMFSLLPRSRAYIWCYRLHIKHR